MNYEPRRSLVPLLLVAFIWMFVTLGLGVVAHSASAEESACENSPLYGKILWDISSCSMGIEFKEDCTIDLLVMGQSKAEKTFIGKYHGLELSIQEKGSKADQPIKMTFSPNQTFDRDALQGKARRLINNFIENHRDLTYIAEIQYMELVLANAHKFQMNLFMLLDQPFADKKACLASPVFLFKDQQDLFKEVKEGPRRVRHRGTSWGTSRGSSWGTSRGTSYRYYDDTSRGTSRGTSYRYYDDTSRGTSRGTSYRYYDGTSRGTSRGTSY